MSSLHALSQIDNEVSSLPPAGRTRVARPMVVVIGIDTLEVSIHLRITDDSIFQRFSDLKIQIQQGMGFSIPVNFGNEEYFNWNLQRTGNKLYPFILKSGDVTLLLSSRSHESSIPNCKIEIGSVSSQECAFKMYAKLLEWLRIYGFFVHKEIVSRVDLAADFLGLKFSELGVDTKSRWISRGRDFNTYGTLYDLTSVRIGSGRLMLRIYDKSEELKKNQVKSDFFHELWGVPEGTDVTRVEFQLRRVVLKEFAESVTTIPELRKNLDSLWQYLVCEWARQTEKPVDRKNKNHKQSKISSFWKQVQGVYFKIRAYPNHRIRKNLHKNLIALRQQIRGCSLNIAAAAGLDKDDFFGIISTCIDALSSDLAEYMSDNYSAFVFKYKQRRNEIYVGY